MKKMKRLSLFLALTLVLTTCFAGFENIYAGTVSNENGGKVTSVTAQDANSTEAVKTYVAKMTTGSDNVTVIPVTTKKPVPWQFRWKELKSERMSLYLCTPHLPLQTATESAPANI